jgi:hypothetical protein
MWPHTIEKVPQIAGPVSLARRHVLGELYGRCDVLAEEIPLYLDGGDAPEVLGHVDQALGVFRDAFSFHVTSDVGKGLCAGYYTFAFDCEQLRDRRVRLVSITLKQREKYEKPIARRNRSAQAKVAEDAVTQ